MDRSTTLSPQESLVGFWKRRFLKQKHVNIGVKSLLRKYGVAADRDGVVKDFLLTLMGNLIVSEACVYRMTQGQQHFVAGLSLGRTRVDALPVVESNGAFAKSVCEAPAPCLLNTLPRAATDHPDLGVVLKEFDVVAALQFEGSTLGIVLLGPKVSGAAYTDDDMELLDALCAVTAAVLCYLDRHGVASMPESRATRIIARCQQVAGGVAGHLERAVAGAEALVRGGNSGPELYQHLEQIKSLIGPLRILERDPGSLDGNAGVAFDPVAAVVDAVFELNSTLTSHTWSVSLPPGTTSTERMTGISSQDLVQATKATLRRVLNSVPDASRLSVEVDHCDRMPANVGGHAPRDNGADDVSTSILRVRIEGSSGEAGQEGGQDNAMRLLADNLQAFQSVRDTDPAQAPIVSCGGMIVSREQSGTTTTIIYLPLLP